MRNLALCALVIALSACVGDDKYKALEKERDGLKAQVAALNDTSKVQAIRSDGLGIIHAIASDAYYPRDDYAKLATILAPENQRYRLVAFKDQTAAVQKVLTAYQQAIAKQLPALDEIQAKITEQQGKIDALVRDAKAAKERVDVSDFQAGLVMVARKFDEDADSNSFYEALDYAKNRKVVLLVPKDMRVTPGNQIRIYTKNLGDRPVQNTVTNDFRSYQQTEYLPVLQMANSEEKLALQGADAALQQLKQQLSVLQTQVDPAYFHAKMQIEMELARLTPQIQQLAGTAGCTPPQLTPAKASVVDAQAGTKAFLYAQCVVEWKHYLSVQAGRPFGPDDENRSDTHCQEAPAETLCLTKKASEVQGALNLDQITQFKKDCGLL